MYCTLIRLQRCDIPLFTDTRLRSMVSEPLSHGRGSIPAIAILTRGLMERVYSIRLSKYPTISGSDERVRSLVPQK